MTRTTLAKGIYRDKFGVVIRISINGRPKDYRADADGVKYDTRDLDWLRKERIRRQAAATLVTERQQQQSSTFAADVARFLDTISSASHRTNTHGYMQHWIRIFGDRARDTITDVDVKTAFNQIDKAPSTRNHIRHALMDFYRVLNGPNGYNPATILEKVPERYEDSRALPYDTIEAIFKALQPSPAKARLMVMAYTGLPQKLIKQIQPGDLRLARKEIDVRPRRKGKGVPARTLRLSDAGVAAFKEFQRVNAFGSFQNRQLVNTFRHGATLAKARLPFDDTRPYDLRHSFLTELGTYSHDLHGVSELGMHATLEQTRRYIKGAASARATKVIAAVPRFSTTPKPQTRGNSKESKGVAIHSKQRRKPRKNT